MHSMPITDVIARLDSAHWTSKNQYVYWSSLYQRSNADIDKHIYAALDSCTCTSACTYIWTIHCFDSWAVHTLLKARVTSLVRHHPYVGPSLTLPRHVTNSTIAMQVVGDLLWLFQSSYSSETPRHGTTSSTSRRIGYLTCNWSVPLYRPAQRIPG